MKPDGRGNRLRLVCELREIHMGRTITIPGDPEITGTLAGLIPLGDTVQAVLIVGSSRLFTDAIPGDTHVEVWQKGAVR